MPAPPVSVQNDHDDDQQEDDDGDEDADGGPQVPGFPVVPDRLVVCLGRLFLGHFKDVNLGVVRKIRNLIAEVAWGVQGVSVLLEHRGGWTLILVLFQGHVGDKRHLSEGEPLVVKMDQQPYVVPDALLAGPHFEGLRRGQILEDKGPLRRVANPALHDHPRDVAHPGLLILRVLVQLHRLHAPQPVEEEVDLDGPEGLVLPADPGVAADCVPRRVSQERGCLLEAALLAEDAVRELPKPGVDAASRLDPVVGVVAEVVVVAVALVRSGRAVGHDAVWNRSNGLGH